MNGARHRDDGAKVFPIGKILLFPRPDGNTKRGLNSRESMLYCAHTFHLPSILLGDALLLQLFCVCLCVCVGTFGPRSSATNSNFDIRFVINMLSARRRRRGGFLPAALWIIHSFENELWSFRKPKTFFPASSSIKIKPKRFKLNKCIKYSIYRIIILCNNR